MPEMHAGLEQCIDELAAEIGMDQVEFRRRNCLRDGSILVTGSKMHPTGLSQCLEKTAEAIGWGHKDEPSAANKRRGKGLALMWKAPAMPPNAGSSAWVELAEDGRVTVGVGGQDLGQGAFTVAAQMAAAALGVPYEWVHVATPLDTLYSPYEWQTVASRLTWSMGNAIKAASEDARAQILEIVARYWDEEVSDLDIRDGQVISFKSEESMSLNKMVIYGLPLDDDAGWMGGPIIGRGKFMPTYVTSLDPETGQGVVIMTNSTTGNGAIRFEILAAIAAAYGWPLEVPQ